MLKMRLEAPRNQQHPLTEQAEIQIRTTTLQTTRKLTMSMKTQKSAPMTTSLNPFSQRSPFLRLPPRGSFIYTLRIFIDQLSVVVQIFYPMQKQVDLYEFENSLAL